MTEDKIGNFTLTSTKKNVGAAVRKIAAASYEKDFPGGEHLEFGLEFGLKEGGVNLTKGQLSKEAYEAVTTAKKQIIDGKIKVPEN